MYTTIYIICLSFITNTQQQTNDDKPTKKTKTIPCPFDLRNPQTIFITTSMEDKTEMSKTGKKHTFRIAKSNMELIRNLQQAVQIEEQKELTLTDIINTAIAELFNKKDYMDDVDYVATMKVLKCYNIL